MIAADPRIYTLEGLEPPYSHLLCKSHGRLT